MKKVTVRATTTVRRVGKSYVATTRVSNGRTTRTTIRHTRVK